MERNDVIFNSLLTRHRHLLSLLSIKELEHYKEKNTKELFLIRKILKEDFNGYEIES